jgi:hypothetical protein
MREKANLRRTVIGLLILQMWLVGQALALDPQASSYLRADFTVEEGLPDNTGHGFVEWDGDIAAQKAQEMEREAIIA